MWWIQLLIFENWKGRTPSTASSGASLLTCWIAAALVHGFGLAKGFMLFGCCFSQQFCLLVVPFSEQLEMGDVFAAMGLLPEGSWRL